MPCSRSGAASSRDRALKASPAAWLGLAALLAVAALGGALFPASALDWQPALAVREPWRAFTAVAVHYSPRHLGVNLAGTALVAALGWAARVPASMAAAHLTLSSRGMRRALGAGLGAGLVMKVLLETPWGAPLRHPPGWDIATAPLGHATGLAAGVACALVAHASMRHHAGRTTPSR